MECLIHSLAFNCAKMAWVAGVGGTRPRSRGCPVRSPRGGRAHRPALGTCRIKSHAVVLALLQKLSAFSRLSLGYTPRAGLAWNTLRSRYRPGLKRCFSPSDVFIFSLSPDKRGWDAMRCDPSSHAPRAAGGAPEDAPRELAARAGEVGPEPPRARVRGPVLLARRGGSAENWLTGEWAPS